MTPERWLHGLLLLDEPGTVGIARCENVAVRHLVAETLVRDLASVHDLRAPILDPCAVIDLLVETYFPEGPAGLV